MSGDIEPSACDPVLAKSSFFAGMNEAEINIVAVYLEPLHIKRGDSVFKEGDEGDKMFIHLSGTLVAFVTQPDGTQRQMFGVKLGDFFGEMSIINNVSRTATITAMEDTEIVALPGKDFYKIVYDHPLIGVKMLKAICCVQNVWLDQTSRHLSDLNRWGESARRRAITDEMTGLYNRRFLDDSIKDRFEHGSVGIRTMSLLMLDLDRIHAINDQHGMAAGDIIFMVVADILRACTREGDICARFAGDEYAVFLPDTGPEEALVIAERIRETVFDQKIAVPKTPGATDKVEINTRTSIGVAIAPLHAKDREALMLAADNALRKAKEKGRNRVEFAD
jgi:diguanylate cyclase (GGDEF)-like protein